MIDALSTPSGNQPVVVFLFTDSDDRKFALPRAASEEYERKVLQSMPVATELASGVKCVSLDYATLTPELRKQYSIAGTCPQVLIYDHTGKLLNRFNSEVGVTDMTEALKKAKALVKAAIEKAQAKK